MSFRFVASLSAGAVLSLACWSSQAQVDCCKQQEPATGARQEMPAKPDQVKEQAQRPPSDIDCCKKTSDADFSAAGRPAAADVRLERAPAAATRGLTAPAMQR